jgi:DNA-binding CsgD family transcriptional regulator
MTLAELTPRQRQVVALRCDYYSAKEISAQLGIEIKTVRFYLDGARKRFKAHNAGELYRRARLMGICE